LDCRTQIITPSYFAPISHWKKICEGKVLWEVNENFIKQSLRNRLKICGPNKVLKLVIPIKHKKKKFTIGEAIIDNNESWQNDHWRSIKFSYNSSPFYEYYKDELNFIYNTKYEKLIDFNFDCIKLVFKWLRLDFKLNKTKLYIKTYNEFDDLREMSNKTFNDRFQGKKYIQVFSEKYGFINNLSILDLIFNQGPNAINFLK